MLGAIKNVYWKKKNVTIHPFVADVKNTLNNKNKIFISMNVISDYLVHVTTIFWTSQKVNVFDLIKEVPQIKYIKYFSDRTSVQHNNLSFL